MRTLPVPVLILLMITLVWCASGCGKKGDPRPTLVRRLPSISDLRVDKVEGHAELRWSLPEGVQGDWRIRILRSESIDSKSFCSDCPQTYRQHAELRQNDERLKRMGVYSFRYADLDVRAGYIYLYRVTICLPSGPCGDESNSAGPVRG